MKTKCLILVALLVTILVACGKEEIVQNENTYDVEIPLVETYKYVVPVDSSFYIEETNRNSYWKFNDGTIMYKTSTKATDTLKHNDEFDFYYGNTTLSKEVGDYNIYIVSNKDSIDKFKASVAYGSEVSKTYNLKVEDQLKELPKYEDKEMIIDDNGMVMPIVNSQPLKNLYTSSIYIEDSASYLESFILDRKIDDLMPELLNIVTSNSDEEDVIWYKDDDYVFLKCGSNITAAKKLHMNSYYIYNGSSNMQDEILSGLKKIHLDK